MKTKTHNRGRYINVLGSAGDFREVVPEGTEGSERREYETSDGATGVKHELRYDEIEVMLTGMSFDDGKYGQTVQIDVNNGEATIQLSTSNSYGTDFMSKLPNVDLTKEVVLSPYSFTPEGESKDKRGMTITQDGEKIMSFFYDGKKNVNGFPEIEKTKEEIAALTPAKYKKFWRDHFETIEEFLVEYTKENIKFPEVEQKETDTDTEALEQSLEDSGF